MLSIGIKLSIDDFAPGFKRPQLSSYGSFLSKGDVALSILLTSFTGGGICTTKIIQLPIPASHMFPPKSSTTMRITRLDLVSHKWRCTRFAEKPYRFWCAKSAAQQLATGDNDADDEVIITQQKQEHGTVSQMKQDLFASLRGLNRGIFGVPSTKKTEIENLVELLEAQNPNPQPTLYLEKVGGAWKLIYSTITILGSKRTKLGLRDFITLGDFFQYINVAEGKAVNVVKFNARGLSLLSGQLTIDASFKIASHSRVDIGYNKSVITPEQLMNVFRKNYDLLLGIFNPEGWLEITYVDDSLRIGRDDKGNIFILERVEEEDAKG